MAKVTIVISDEGKDGVRFRAEFDPPVTSASDLTPAQALGALTADYAMDKLDRISETSTTAVETVSTNGSQAN